MAGPEITAVITQPPELSSRDHRTFLREANKTGAVHHHEQHIPRHFTHIAAAKYGYAKRVSRFSTRLTYQELKDRLGLPPLVSPRITGGTTRHHITTMRRITGTYDHARLIMRLPFRGGTGRFRLLPGERELTPQQKVVLQIIAEIETIAPDEQRTIARLIAASYATDASSRIAAKVESKIARSQLRDALGRFRRVTPGD